MIDKLECRIMINESIEKRVEKSIRLEKRKDIEIIEEMLKRDVKEDRINK